MNAMTFFTKGPTGIRLGALPLSPLTLLLAAVLAAQILLAVILSLGQQDLSTSPDSPLLAFDHVKVDRLQIERSGSEPLVLARQDGRWVIPAIDDFPASEPKVDDLLDRLSSLRRRLPVATSEEGLARFNVAEADFEGRLTLADDDEELAVLYLGDSAGFRRQYVRAAGQTAVYEAEIGPADTPVEPDDWADRSWLREDERDIQRILLPDVALERDKEGDGWHLAEAREGETLDQEAVSELVSQLAGLSFTTVLGTAEKPEYGQDEPVLEWQLELASGERRSYTLSPVAPFTAESEASQEDDAEAAPEPESYVLKVSDRPYFLELATYMAERITAITREGLLVEPPVAEEDEEIGADAASAPPDDESATRSEDAAAESKDAEPATAAPEL